MGGFIPTGTVTFLFTDIEGSTKLWERYPIAMRAALAHHDTLLRQAIEAKAGYVFKTVGDAFCAAFTTAPQAVEAALAAQLALKSSNEDADLLAPKPDIRVRMALHSGTAEERDGDYFGQALNRVARLLVTGHGGQILLSAATQELVRDHLSDNIQLKDLGEHRLKDLTRPERVYQLVNPALPQDFPPLKSLDSLPNNLPIQLTSFIGREREIAEVKRLLSQTRLLTLTGAGGAGKTRLSLQVAAELLESFEEGVWFVELAPLSDPPLLPQTVATTLKVQEQPNRRIVDTLIDFLQQTRILLILDNCEHLVEAAAQLTDSLLRACPKLHILVSSREELGIGGETAYRVPSLSVPDQKSLSRLENLNQYEAVRLFIERAISAQPNFSVTNQNAPALAQTCYRLDGIPLAIELAAARVKVLTLEQIASRLDDRFSLLTGGSRTALPRQQTLRATIDWSYNLLSPAEQKLLERLAVFARGSTLEAVEAVCGSDGIEVPDVLDLLAQLVNKSLVVVEEANQGARYRLLETIRQYGWEKLESQGQWKAVRTRHAVYFGTLAKAEGPKLIGPEVAIGSAHLEREHANLRAALDWALAQANVELVLELDGGIFLFWLLRFHCSEGRNYLNQTLALPDLDQPARKFDRATILWNNSFLTLRDGSYAEARELALAGLELFQELGDKAKSANCLRTLGMVSYDQGDIATARPYFEESLVLSREAGDKVGIAMSLGALGDIALKQKDYDTTRYCYEESMSIKKEVGWKQGVLVEALNLGFMEVRLGNYQRGLAFLKEGLAGMYEAHGLRGWVWITEFFASLALLAGYLGSKAGLPAGKVQESYLTRAAILSGIAARLRASISYLMSQPEPPHYEEARAIARDGLGEAAFTAAFDEGQAMPEEQIMEYVLSMEIVTDPPAETVETPTPEPSDNPDKLTNRELEVLKLVAEGLTDPQIAEKLSLSPRTVNAHLRTIFSKIGVTTRSAATRYAIEHDLL